MVGRNIMGAYCHPTQTISDENSLSLELNTCSQTIQP
jgi:hypothetical protein